MKVSNANKVVSVLLSVAMCPMMVPSAAFAADDGAASGASSPSEQVQPADQAEGVDAGASSSDTIAPQSETADASTGEAAAPAAAANGEGAETAPREEGTEAAVAEVNGTTYLSLQEAINAASRNATVKLLADTKENVTISTNYVTLDLNGHTLNGSTGERKPALTVTSKAYVVDSSAAQTGTIMREDTAENSGVSSHYVIDVQGGNSGWLFFQSGNVKNDSGAGGTKGASLVRVGDGSKPGVPGLTISGGTFTQNNFIVLKCDYGNLYVKGGEINSANSYAVQNWKNATIKDSAVINGNVSTWTYGGGGSDLQIQGGTVNGDIESVTYDGVEGKPAKVSITGGTVNGTLNTVDYSTGTASTDPTKATIEVTAGTFSNDPSRYLIEGSTATKNEDGSYGVAKAYLAQVGETSYYTMDEAFKAQTENGGVITLLRDYTTGSTFNSGTVARVVDLNGHTWMCTGTDANSAAFEINNPNASLTVKNGKIVSSQLIGLIPSAMGGTITYDNSTLTFEGVEASTTATSGVETNGNNTNDTVVLKNSTLNVPNGFGIYFPSSGTLTIDNSTINAKTMGAQVCSGNLNVTAGSAITVSGDPVEKTEGDGAIQDGAAISIVNRAGYKGLGQIAIAGGTFTAKAGNAAIKAYTWDSATKQESAFDNSTKTVAVSGGTFSSAVSADLCAEGCTPIANADGTYSVGAPVAQIGDKVFTSIQAAINAAQAGDTVQLIDDTVVDSTVIVQDKGAITLDLNGKAISNTKEIWNEDINNWSLVSVRGNSDLTITGNGAIDALANDSYAIDLQDATSKCTIENGTFNGNITAVYIMEGALAINGGTFNIKQLSSQGDHRFTINCYDSSYKNGTAQVTIAGGTFNGFDPANNLAEGAGTAFTAPGYTSVANADGTYGVVAGVAQVAGKAFTSLQAAIDAAQDGETVTLLTDATEDATIAAGKNITLDLGGKTLTNTSAGKATVTIAKDATATVKNGSVIGGTSFYTIQNNGTATLEDVTAAAGNTGSSMIDNWGTLTITSGTYTGGLNVVKSEEGSKLTIAGGTFTLDYATDGYTAVILVYGDTTISGGEFIQSLTTTGRWDHPQVVATGAVEGYTAITRVTGGNFVNKKSGEGIFRGVGKGTSDNFEVSGGTFNKSITEDYCANGFIPTQNADGTYGVKEGHYVAQVGSTKYETLADAIRLAAKGKTIQLLTDTTENITIATTKQITLDLNGHTLNGGTGTAKAAILNQGNMTITDSSADKTGTIKRDDQGIEGETSYYVIDNNGTMVIDQANVVNNSGAKGSSLIRNGGVDNVSSLTINGGTLEQQNFIAVKNDGNGELTINGGTLTSKQSVVQNWNKAQILGGNLTGLIWTDSWTEAGTIGETVIGGDAQFTGTIYMDVTGPNPSTLKIEGGSLDVTKWTVTDAAAAADATIAVSGGTFTAAVPENYCAAGYAPTANGDGTYGVVAGVAQIGTKAYATLADAVAAAKDGDTITLLSNCSGDGIVVKGDTFPNGLTIDFAGHSYTVGGKLVGSSGTASNGFQLLKGNTIVMRNGSIYGDASVAGDDTTQWSGSPAIMIQNYSNLTLDGMTVKGGKQTCYTLSNNNGDTVIKDSTIIAGQNANYGGPFAFDVCRYASYPSVSVAVEGNSVIDGCVDVSGAIGEGQSRQLTITGGTFSKPITVSTEPANIAISGGTFANEVPANYCAAGYAPTANADGTYGVKLAEGAYLLQDYRSGDQASWTYPTQEGMAFAGWYKDASFTTACSVSDVKGAAYAKFVPITDLLRFKGGSLRMDVAQPSELTWLRFDCTMALPEGASFVENGWYFKKVSTSQPTDVRRLANNNVLNIDGTITANLVFTGVATNYYSANFSEKAFVKYVTADGTTVEAVESDYQVNSVLGVADVILAHPMASKAEKDYATQIKAAV